MNDADSEKHAKELLPEPGRKRPLVDVLSFAGPYLGLIIVIGLFSFLTGQNDRFLNWGNARLILVHTAVPATVGLGMTIIMVSGGIDLSVGYVVSLVTVTSVLAYRRLFPGAGMFGASLGAVAVGVSTGVLAGLLNGMMISWLKVVPFVATLGMMGAAQGLARFLSGGERLTFPGGLPGWLGLLGGIDLELRPQWVVAGPEVWSAGGMAILVSLILNYSVLGRYCFALGSNEATARLCGIQVEKTKILLYSLGGLLTGLGGILQLARSGSGSYDVSAGLELDVIAAVVIGGGSLNGGEGTVTGTLVGALMITVLANGCSKVGLPTELRLIIIGILIVLVSALNSWRQRRFR